MIIAKFAIAAAVGYTLGSIPFGFLVVKKMTGIDIRKRGSNKLGTTNVLRVAGRKELFGTVALREARPNPGEHSAALSGHCIRGRHLDPEEYWRTLGHAS